MASFGIDNSIGWAHWSLRGGWKYTLMTTGGFALVAAVIIYVAVQMNPGSTATVLAFARSALLVLQSGILVLFGASRVAAAIKADVTSRMLESHRLMPVAPAVAISGYLWGPPAQAIVLGAAIFVIGLIVTVAGGMDLRIWVGPNIILASFALFCWVVMAFSSSLTKGGGAGVIVGLIMFMTFTQGVITVVAPGIMLLLSPLIGKTIFTSSLANTELTWPRLASFVAQALVGTVLYIGAARKYRRSDDTALAVAPALCLLLCWVGMSTLVLWKWDLFRMDIRMADRASMPTLIICSVLTSLLLALVPVANAARRSSLLLSPLVAIASASAIVLMAVALRDHSEHDVPYTLLITAGAVGSFLLSHCYVLGIVYRVTDRGMTVGFIALLLLWLVPLSVDWARWIASQGRDDFEPTWIGSISPVGAVMLAWGRFHSDATVGVLCQLGIAVVLAILFYLTLPKIRRAALDGRT